MFDNIRKKVNLEMIIGVSFILAAIVVFIVWIMIVVRSGSIKFYVPAIGFSFLGIGGLLSVIGIKKRKRTNPNIGLQFND